MVTLPDFRDAAMDGKTVLLRADLNVPFKGSAIADHARIHRAATTINVLVSRGARVVVMAHLDRPKGVANPVMSIAPVASALSDELNRSVRFVPDCVGATAERWTRSLAEGDVALLENLRFHAEEEEDDRSFALLLSVHGDLYINDAPASSIRQHASIRAIVPLMRAYAGPQLLAHVATLDPVEAARLPGVAALMSTMKVSGDDLMARITLRQLLDHAAEGGYGVPAFNINNMEQALAIMEAARDVSAPVILQASRGARSYAGDIMLGRIIDALEEIFPEIPLCMHQDHGNNVATCLSALQHGYTSVMMDGSLEEDGKTPSDYDYNVAITSEVSRLAHFVGASVEGEIGVLGSLETGSGEAEDGVGFEGTLQRHLLVTDPEEAKRFVAATKVDALAVAIGTSHGAYKFTRKPSGEILAMDIIEKLHELLPTTHLVMHGSSSVPKEWQDVFNAHGGAMRETWGVPVEEIIRGIKHGVRKVNIDTDLRLAATAAFRRAVGADPAEFDPRKFLKPAIEAMRKVCRERFEAFGTAGNAPKIKVVPMSEMAKRYAAGTLDPRVTTPIAA